MRVTGNNAVTVTSNNASIRPEMTKNTIPIALKKDELLTNSALRSASDARLRAERRRLAACPQRAGASNQAGSLPECGGDSDSNVLISRSYIASDSQLPPLLPRPALGRWSTRPQIKSEEDTPAHPYLPQLVHICPSCTTRNEKKKKRGANVQIGHNAGPEPPKATPPGGFPAIAI
jgi:hypothetical protein